MGDEWEKKLLDAAKPWVGKDAVLKDKFGKDCFVLVDMLLREIGAATAEDGKVTVTPTADYDWGDKIEIKDIAPGDILQFSKHTIHTEFDIFDAKGKKTKTGKEDLWRGHHSAIVQSVNGDGSYTIIEQNVYPNPDKVHANTIPALTAGVTEKEVEFGYGKKVMKITVKGTVKAYRPKVVPKDAKRFKKKEKTAMLHSQGGIGGMANFVPSEGGPRRPPGHIGGPMDDGEWDVA